MPIVVDSLVTVYIRTRNKNTGAHKSLVYHQTQLETDERIIAETAQDLAELEAAILAAGGKLPHDDEAEKGDEEAPQLP